MPRKSKKRSLAAKKGWETRRKKSRSLAAKKGWETRRKNKQQEQTWFIRYKTRSKKNPFNGELVFTTKEKMTDTQANEIAAKFLKGETVSNAKFKKFSYDHAKGEPKLNREVDELDATDFDFLVYDNDSGYVSATSQI